MLAALGSKLERKASPSFYVFMSPISKYEIKKVLRFPHYKNTIFIATISV